MLPVNLKGFPTAGLPEWYHIAGSRVLEGVGRGIGRRVLVLRVLGQEGLHCYAQSRDLKSWELIALDFSITVPEPVDLLDFDQEIDRVLSA